MLSETIKHLRKQNNLTQEQLAEKLNVSRQAITKWESGIGTPDIGNLEALAKAFSVSYDVLLSDGEAGAAENVSRTEFDVFGKDDFELSFGNANVLDVSLSDCEKIVVEIRTDLQDKAYDLAKVKLENGRKINIAVVEIKLDKQYISVETNKTLSKQDAKKHLWIKVLLPKEFSNRIELNGDVHTLLIHDIPVKKHLEFDGKAENVRVSGACGHFELTPRCDLELHYDGSMEQLDINQLRCISNLYLKAGAPVHVYNKGRSCDLVFDGYESVPDAEHKVELNGFKTELTVRAE